MKTYDDPSLSNRYSVRFDESRRVVEFLETDIIGPGFQNIISVHLQPGQVVFVTHNQREMMARVIRHDVETQDVLLRISEVISLSLFFFPVSFTNCGFWSKQNLSDFLSLFIKLKQLGIVNCMVNDSNLDFVKIGCWFNDDSDSNNEIRLKFYFD